MGKMAVTNSKQFWVSLDDMMKFAEVLEESGLNNCMVGPDGDYIIMDVDYDDNDAHEMKYIIELQEVSDGDYEKEGEDDE